MYTPLQLSKLPKWAQDEILHLTNQIKTLSSALAQYEGDKESPISQQSRTEWKFVPIPEGNIRFTLLRESRDSYIDVRIEEDHLYVNGGGLRSYLLVRPKAANVVEIGVSHI